MIHAGPGWLCPTCAPSSSYLTRVGAETCSMLHCFATARAFAKDKRAHYPHVCRLCFKDMRPEDQDHYTLEPIK